MSSYLIIAAVKQANGAPAGAAINRVVADEGFNPGAGLAMQLDDGRALWFAPQPTLVVLSVLPVSLRRALRSTPWPNYANALAYVQAALSNPGYENAADAWEYAVRYFRDDILALGSALGLTASVVDAMMTLAATYPGAEPVFGAAS